MSTLLREQPAVEQLVPSAPPGPEPRKPIDLLLPAEGALAILAFAAAAEGVAGSVADAHWQPGLDWLPVLVGLAVLLGYLFTRTHRTHWAYHAAGITAGLLVAVRLLGGGFLSPKLSWQDQVYSVLARLSDWVSGSLNGQVVQDDLLIGLAVACFIFVWTYLSYLLALRAHMPWLAAGLLGAVLFANVLFKSSSGGGWLVLWAAGSLVLILRINVFRRETLYRNLAFAHWRRGTELALAGGMLMAALAALVFAFAPPVPFNERLNELYDKLNGPLGQARRAYDQFGVPKDYLSSQLRVDSFQPQLRFLGPFRPGTDLVMKVKSDRSRYQQGVVFDRYEHTGWTNTQFDRFDSGNSGFQTSIALTLTSRDRSRTQVTEDIIQVMPKGALLFAAPLPVGTSLRLKGDGLGDLRAMEIIQPNQEYTATSLESTATAEELASAQGPVPDSVRANFTQLPADLPSRIKDLALQQTAGAPTSFDKATALESFIRTYKYDTEVPPPPPDRDAVDWFLFDLRRGYSDYTSSAMAVMLRAIGIPSRVVAGYAPGRLDPTDGTFHVTEQQTHTWTQAYFPGYGWIDFEPTPDNPAFPRAHLPRPIGAASEASPTTQPSATATAGPGSAAGPALSNAGAARPGSGQHAPWLWLLLLAVLLTLAWLLYSRMRGTPGVRLAYARVALLGALTGHRQHRWQTPSEYGRLLQLKRGFDPSATDTITSLYSADRYSAQPLDDRGNRRAWTAWNYLRGRFLRPWQR